MKRAGKVGRCLIMVAALTLPASAGKKKTLPTIRWAEQTPGCTFDAGDDGFYRWGLWSSDLGIILGVDSQELVKARKRVGQPLLLKLAFKYRGSSSIDITTNQMTLEFVRHSHVILDAFDPDGFVARMQANAAALEDQAQHELKKHPEKESAQEPARQAYLRDSTEFQDFFNKNALRDIKLDSGNAETTGWIAFSTRNKWVGDWKKQEEFILRIPFEDRVFEIPFGLPPSEGELILRKRP